MIKIFDAKAKDFNTNGLINIVPISCKETKKKSLNGWFLELQIDLKYKDYIKKDMIVAIKSKSKANMQGFRLDEPKINNEIIEVTANHVMFDSNNYMLYDVRPINRTALDSLEYINNRVDQDSTPFIYHSDVEGLNTAYFQLKTLFESWQIIEERWGGIFDADNWNIYFLTNPGKDVGQMLVYQKNIEDIIIYEDWSSVVTTIYPVGNDGLKLPEKFIKADVQYEVPYVKKVEFNDTENIEEENEDLPEKTEDELIEKLRIDATNYLNENKYPKVSYEITSQINEEYDINDKIHVKHPLVDLRTEVQEYTYNHILNKTENLVFGNYTRDVKEKFQNIKDSINNAISKASNNEILIKQQNDLINSLNKNGLVYITDNEILILDQVPKEKAKYVWRLGLGGIGFSENGYEGPFKSAWTQDGVFNADFIGAGHINTNLIEGYNELLLLVNKYIDLTTTVENIGTVDINEIMSSELLYLHIYPTVSDISYLYPRSNLYPSEELFMTSRDLIAVNEKNEEVLRYTLPTDLLFIDENIKDELIIDYAKKQTYCIRRVGINEDGSKYQLSEEQTDFFTYEGLQFEAGSYRLFLESFNDAFINVRFSKQNDLTSQFATHIEMNAAIKTTAEEINLEVSKKIANDDGGIELASLIRQTAELIFLKANNFGWECQNSSMTTDGTLTAKNANIVGGKITLTDGAQIVGDDGLITNLNFVGYVRSAFELGSGDFLPVGHLGSAGATANIDKLNDMVITYKIPENFVILSAKVILAHAPINWKIYSDGSTIKGYSRNLKLYKINNSNVTFDLVDYDIFVNSNVTEIPNAFGSSGFTGNDSNSSFITSIDIKDQLSANSVNQLSIRTSEGISNNTNYIFSHTGGVFGYLEVIGYKKF